jgi:integrase/recombinase XerC
MARRTSTASTPQPAQNRHLTSELEGIDGHLLRGFRLALEGGWRPKLRSDESVRLYCFSVTRLAGFLAGKGMPGLTDCTREHLLEYMAELRRERTPATAGVYLKALKLFFLWLIEEGERRDNPTERISPPPDDRKVVQPYTPSQVKALFASQNPKTLVGARNLALFAILMDTALRREEVVQFRVEDIDWKHGQVKVFGKGSKERVVRVGPSALRYVDTYLRLRARHQIDSPWLLVSSRGVPITKSTVTHIHEGLTAKLGFHCHPHRWRHSAIQEMLDSGMDRESVRVIAGHENYATLQKYTRATDQRRAMEQHRKHSPMDRIMRDR